MDSGGFPADRISLPADEKLAFHVWPHQQPSRQLSANDKREVRVDLISCCKHSLHSVLFEWYVQLCVHVLAVSYAPTSFLCNAQSAISIAQCMKTGWKLPRARQSMRCTLEYAIGLDLGLRNLSGAAASSSCGTCILVHLCKSRIQCTSDQHSANSTCMYVFVHACLQCACSLMIFL